MRTIFEADDTNAVLLIDASNAFNALNRSASLHNIRVLCPPMAIYAINTYRQPARLFVIGGQELESVKGTTQGDPLATSLYAISLQSLITQLQVSSATKQCWFVDDAAGSGSLLEVRKCALGGLGIANTVKLASQEYEVSVTVTGPLTQRIIHQDHHTPDEADNNAAKSQAIATKKREALKESEVRKVLATGSGLASRLKPNNDPNKGEFRDALKLRYNWEFSDIPNRCVCGDIFDVDHAMTCRNGGFVIQRHNEIRDLEAALLSTVCKDVEIEPPLHTSQDTRLDVLARGFWERQKSAYFDVRVFHPYADSYREKTSEQVFKQHENEKKRKYACRVLEIKQGSFTPLTVSTTGGMGTKCKIYHKRLAELIFIKKCETYSTTMSWIRAKISFAFLRCALLCLRGTRKKRKTFETLATDFFN
ncbi:hypothetical protein AWC38_SpisGene5265 [Stylophora pistillata]|uniref:Reverse transcriptase domain-containing protein n=1 Tax=Stylophora pistillata TaxID=50429 RepID=A0A2B4SMX9_STYPI|nr:hypothetical protein AWC38_SpisGene5265 [Stylophora pistillata]